MRAAAVVAVVAALAPAGALAAPSSPVIETFRTPSRNIACAYIPRAAGGVPTLRCDILSGLRPQPRRACRLDWTGLELVAARRARPVCAGDTVYQSSAPILRYGRTWRRGPFVCVSRRIGLRCRERAGHGFLLSRSRWRVF